MLFSSAIFLFLFLPLVLVAYFLSPARYRNGVLLLASLVFYAWGDILPLSLMLLSISLNYVSGLWVDRARGTFQARVALTLGIVANLGVLFYFKYAMFAIDNLNLALNSFGVSPLRSLSVIMPIGISFYTFQAMSYVIDVYRGEAPVERNPFRLALYVSLFPQLIAGPIVRYVDVAADIRSRQVTLDDFATGIRRFILGLGKKVLIANGVAGAADGIFEIPDEQLCLPLAWLGIVCYTLQIYFDFSGYSDMAIGLGRMFGFRFLENFNYPYISQSVTEFWRRWHISLSTWYRDYLYIPLGGNRHGPLKTYRNLMIVFVLCGLWHGASWNFVLWGGFHGLFLILERSLLKSALANCWRPLRHVYLLLTVCVGWVLFRAETLEHALRYLQTMSGAGLITPVAEYPLEMYLDPGLCLVLVAGLLGSLPVVPWLEQRSEAWTAGLISKWATVSLEACLMLGQLTALSVVFGASACVLMSATYNPFIYFRF